MTAVVAPPLAAYCAASFASHDPRPTTLSRSPTCHPLSICTSLLNGAVKAESVNMIVRKALMLLLSLVCAAPSMECCTINPKLTSLRGGGGRQTWIQDFCRTPGNEFFAEVGTVPPTWYNYSVAFQCNPRWFLCLLDSSLIPESEMVQLS